MRFLASALLVLWSGPALAERPAHERILIDAAQQLGAAEAYKHYCPTFTTIHRELDGYYRALHRQAVMQKWLTPVLRAKLAFEMQTWLHWVHGRVVKARRDKRWKPSAFCDDALRDYQRNTLPAHRRIHRMMIKGQPY